MPKPSLHLFMSTFILNTTLLVGQALIASALVSIAILSFAAMLILLSADGDEAVNSFISGMMLSFGIYSVGQTASGPLSRSAKVNIILGITALLYGLLNR